MPKTDLGTGPTALGPLHILELHLDSAGAHFVLAVEKPEPADSNHTLFESWPSHLNPPSPSVSSGFRRLNSP